MQSSDRDRFFESDASRAQRERRAAKAGNMHGSPLALRSKLLAAVPDPRAPLTSVFVAESAGCVRLVRLEAPDQETAAATAATYRGPRAPVTCVAVGGPQASLLFAGSWDKDIWSWDIDSATPGRRYSGHTDFVKTLVTARLSATDVLMSGGADKKVLVWDVATGRRIHTIQDPATAMLAVQHLAVDPALSGPDHVVVACASSDPHIRRWRVSLDACEQLSESFHGRPDAERPTIHEHDTTVYRLVFDADGADVDLWTASADGTAKCLARALNFVADDTFAHGDYVRAVAVTEHWVVTAGRDENIKVWDRATRRLHCTLDGHFDEVTDLVLLRDARGVPRRVCSVSIDQTLRTWPLARPDLDRVVADMRRPPSPGHGAPPAAALTADEEAELAALMDDDDDDDDDD